MMELDYHTVTNGRITGWLTAMFFYAIYKRLKTVIYLLQTLELLKHFAIVPYTPYLGLVSSWEANVAAQPDKRSSDKTFYTLVFENRCFESFQPARLKTKCLSSVDRLMQNLHLNYFSIIPMLRSVLA